MQKANHLTCSDKTLPVVCLLAGLLVANGLATAAEQQKAKPATPVEVASLATVVVNGEPIAEGEVQRELNRLAPVAEYHSLSRERWQALRVQAIDNLVDKELLFREGLRRGISWDEQWVEYIFEKNRQEYKKEGNNDGLFDDKEVKDRLLEDLRRLYVISKLQQQGKADVVPDDKQVKAYYDENVARYQAPKAVKIIELLREMPPASTKADWDKSKKEIDEIHDKLKQGGDFSAYADKENLKLSERTIHVGMPGYDIAGLLEQPDGEIGKPAFTLKGYRIIKKVEEMPQPELSYDAVQEQVRADLHALKYQQWVGELRSSLRGKSKIIIGEGPAYVGR